MWRNRDGGSVRDVTCQRWNSDMEYLGNGARSATVLVWRSGVGPEVQSWSRSPELTWCYECNTTAAEEWATAKGTPAGSSVAFLRRKPKANGRTRSQRRRKSIRKAKQTHHQYMQSSKTYPWSLCLVLLRYVWPQTTKLFFMWGMTQNGC